MEAALSTPTCSISHLSDSSDSHISPYLFFFAYKFNLLPLLPCPQLRPPQCLSNPEFLESAFPLARLLSRVSTPVRINVEYLQPVPFSSTRARSRQRSTEKANQEAYKATCSKECAHQTHGCVVFCQSCPRRSTPVLARRAVSVTVSSRPYILPLFVGPPTIGPPTFGSPTSLYSHATATSQFLWLPSLPSSLPFALGHNHSHVVKPYGHYASSQGIA
jgi:hypothetical protein